MKKFLQAAVLAMLLVLVSAPAWALGLGQLQLKSKLGEPLLAEIPVISADPAELESLQARLAAPDTFLRVGLPLPDKMVSDLRFALVYDAAGKPLIRVTSPGPVAMPMLTFLLEVDWGDGRLVREYSVLLAEPEAVAAAAQPSIESPVAAPSNTIVRSEPLPPPAAAPVQPQPAPNRLTTPTQSPPVPRPIASAAPVAAAAVVANGAQHTVQAGDTLSGVAAQMRSPGQSVNALMAALMSANPDAFINNDPNLLRRGATLDIPAADAVAEASRDGSAAALQEQLAGWRSTRSRRMDAVDVASARDIAAASTPAPAPAVRRVRDARLEIMPATASAAAAAGTRSGTGGEGDAEMTQQLQEARETIATRDAEVAELKSRVAELENLQKQQAQLVQMKDGELAAAQQQLQQRQQVSATTAAPSAANPNNPWFTALAFGLPLLILIGLGAWWMRRRRPAATAGAEPSFTKAAPAPVKPRVSEDASLFPDKKETPTSKPAAEATSTLRKPSWMGVAAKTSAAAPAIADDASLDWRAAKEGTQPSATLPSFAGAAKPVTPDTVPSIHNEPMPRELPPGMGVFDAPDQPVADVASRLAADSRDERIALADTYLQLDDETTARHLLQEVINDGGASADEARRILERIGSLQ
ncbi:FimV/HubP family polar landmark protein [Solilutibacter tolerans]|uniref:Pilus assembly protein FimV n=1 Tax=Solilutibacter tolerans TaxID=1604334 RepID=A0A1N6VTW5_9GAMM|nr:FimV/HubP family polar landmark protein [Lysobacter tolerans]SIQ81106.1 pilus assembly protein FimV [Lysobacter tolerans]